MSKDRRSERQLQRAQQRQPATQPQAQIASPRRHEIVQEQHLSYTSPFPPPEVLHGYNQVVPGGAERVFKLVEGQQEHRHEQEAAMIKGAIAHHRRGQWMGFGLGMSGMGIAAGCIVAGHAVAGASSVATTLVALVAVFVVGERKKPPPPRTTPKSDSSPSETSTDLAATK